VVVLRAREREAKGTQDAAVVEICTISVVANLPLFPYAVAAEGAGGDPCLSPACRSASVTGLKITIVALLTGVRDAVAAANEESRRVEFVVVLRRCAAGISGEVDPIVAVVVNAVLASSAGDGIALVVVAGVVGLGVSRIAIGVAARVTAVDAAVAVVIDAVGALVVLAWDWRGAQCSLAGGGDRGECGRR
jgi:hypothetical protein